MGQQGAAKPRESCSLILFSALSNLLLGNQTLIIKVICSKKKDSFMIDRALVNEKVFQSKCKLLRFPHCYSHLMLLTVINERNEILVNELIVQQQFLNVVGNMVRVTNLNLIS